MGLIVREICKCIKIDFMLMILWDENESGLFSGDAHPVIMCNELHFTFTTVTVMIDLISDTNMNMCRQVRTPRVIIDDQLLGCCRWRRMR